MLADILLTSFNRPNLLEMTCRSLFACTDKSSYRLTIINDGSGTSTRHVIDQLISTRNVDYYLEVDKNQGLGPAINNGLALINSVNTYLDHPTHGLQGSVAPFVVYVQDDVLFSEGWLLRLSKMFTLFEKQYNLGFATGVTCPEHPILSDIGGGMVIKDWIRATMMFARREYVMSMWPIPRFDPETGRVRAKPDHGMGSGVDWHFIRNHENSVCKTGKHCIVIPGLVKHIGYDDSTWLDRDLPETKEDLEAMKA